MLNDIEYRMLEVELLKVVNDIVDVDGSWKGLLMIRMCMYVVRCVENREVRVEDFRSYYDECIDCELDF